MLECINHLLLLIKSLATLVHLFSSWYHCLIGSKFNENVESFIIEYHPSTYLPYFVLHRTSEILSLILSTLSNFDGVSPFFPIN